MRNHSHQISRKTLKHILFALFFIGSLGTPKASAFFQQEDQEQEIGFDQYKGKIMDSDSKKPLVFATLTVENTNISTISNTEGEFALKVPESMKEGNVIVAFLGYKNKSIKTKKTTVANRTKSINIQPTSIKINKTSLKNKRSQAKSNKTTIESSKTPLKKTKKKQPNSNQYQSKSTKHNCKTNKNQSKPNQNQSNWIKHN